MLFDEIVTSYYFPEAAKQICSLKLPPCLNFDRIKLETWNLVRKYIHIYIVSEDIIYIRIPRIPLTLLKLAFLGQNSTFPKAMI